MYIKSRPKFIKSRPMFIKSRLNIAKALSQQKESFWPFLKKFWPKYCPISDKTPTLFTLSPPPPQVLGAMEHKEEVHSKMFLKLSFNCFDILIVLCYKKWANPSLFFVYFQSFQTIINTNFPTNQCEKMSFHPVFGAMIQTLDLLNMSRHP